MTLPLSDEASAPLTDAPLLSLDDVVLLHALSVAQFGGTPAVADQPPIERALQRPMDRFNGGPYYPTAHLRAAAMGHSLSVHRPFGEATATTTIYIVAVWLEREGHGLHVPPGHLRLLGDGLDAGSITVAELTSWLEACSLALATECAAGQFAGPCKTHPRPKSLT